MRTFDSLAPIVFSLAILLPTVLCTVATAADPIRELRSSWPAAELEGLRFDISVAELEASAGVGDEVEIEIVAECRSDRSDCARTLEELELVHRTRGSVLTVDLDGYPKWGKGRIEVEAYVKIPTQLDFELDMGVGEVNIEGLEGNLDLELGVGELTIGTKPGHLRSVSLDVGVGEADIHGIEQKLEERRSFLVGSELYWGDGKGDKRIKVDVGVGEATVRLD